MKKNVFKNVFKITTNGKTQTLEFKGQKFNVMNMKQAKELLLKVGAL